MKIKAERKTIKVFMTLPIVLVCILAAFGLSACESTQGLSSSSSSASASSSSSAVQSTATSSTISGDNVLVVYYSASGNTEKVANEIASATGAATFEIVPAEPYTSDDLYWQNPESRVNKEHEDESLRDIELVSTEVPDWDSYDTVFIGYPIWWAIAAWPVDGFVEANDFTGKTVIPFCTSTSSGIGQSGELLSELAGSGDWQSGMRFASSADQAEVDRWLDSLGL